MTQFGYLPRLQRGTPPIPVVPRSRIPSAAPKAVVRRNITLPKPLPPVEISPYGLEFTCIERSGSRAAVRRICEEVCQRYSVSMDLLMSHRRDNGVVVARQEAMWRARRETSLSYPEIGNLMGGKDHTTIIYGVRKHAERLARARKSSGISDL